MTRRASGL